MGCIAGVGILLFVLAALIWHVATLLVAAMIVVASVGIATHAGEACSDRWQAGYKGAAVGYALLTIAIVLVGFALGSLVI